MFVVQDLVRLISVKRAKEDKHLEWCTAELVIGESEERGTANALPSKAFCVLG